MSPSLIRALMRRITGPVSIMRIRLTCNKLYANYHVDDHVTWSSETTFDEPIFLQQADERAAAILTNALAPVATWLHTHYARIEVIVPDPLVRGELLQFDKLPWQPQARHALIAWRLGNERAIDSGQVVLSTQFLGKNREGKHLVYVGAMNKVWRNTIRSAMAQHGLDPVMLDIVSRYTFNNLDCEHAGALVSVDEDAYALMVWNEEGALQLYRSAWRKSIHRETLNTQVARTLSEIERLLLSYQHQFAANPLSALYLSASENEYKQLATGLSESFGLTVLPAVPAENIDVMLDAAADVAQVAYQS